MDNVIMSITYKYIMTTWKTAWIITCALFLTDTLEAFKPIFTFSDQDMAEGNFISMTCTVNNAPCDPIPEYIYLEKQVGQDWHEACELYMNNTYVPIDLPGGNTVKDRGQLFYFPESFVFYLYNLNLKDNGNWRCTLRDCKNDDLPSENVGLTVSSNLSESDITITPPDYILLNSPSDYNCYSGRVYPEANVTWTQGGQNYSGIPDNKYNGEYWEIQNTHRFIFCDRSKMGVNCTLEKTSGTRNWTVTTTAPSAPVFAPAIVETSTISSINPNISDTLTISCTGSGTAHTITWYKEGSVLEDGLFLRNDVSETGEFTCGETEGTKSTLTWIQLDNPTCENMNRHDGKYLCTVNADKDTSDKSEEYSIFVLYPPYVPFSMVRLEALIGDEVSLNCVVDCAMPDVLTFSWMREDTQEDMMKNESIIMIQITDTDFNTTIRCTAKNDVGSNFIRFVLTEKQVSTQSEQPHETTTPFDTETTTYPEEPESPNQALLTAFAVIWSLCGVFAILVICLALYHYRQIQNGKKYKGEYSEEIVLTEDEAAPGTAQGSGVYDDISPAVVGKGSVSGASGGVPNEGLYEEVQRPAQIQIPVAPTRTSKLQASQPNPGPPKTKRTQTPAAQKSPMNAQHQPNSPSSDRRPEPKAEYSPVFNKKEMPPNHSHDSNHVTVSKVVQNKKRHEAPTKPAPVKQNTNGTKPSVPVKPDIQSFRSSRSSGVIPAGAPYDNAEVNLYANCDQRAQEQKNGDGTITYADLALQQEDPYEEGAPPVPKKNMTDQEPVQYASIKRNK